MEVSRVCDIGSISTHAQSSARAQACGCGDGLWRNVAPRCGFHARRAACSLEAHEATRGHHRGRTGDARQLRGRLHPRRLCGARVRQSRRRRWRPSPQRLPDLAVIDISLEDEPEGGFELCRQLRALSAELPIIFLTARDSELDAVSGLRLGADDFLTKDLSIPHLIARVNALFRRVEALRKPQAPVDVIRRGALTLDAERMQRAMGRQGGAAVAHRVLDRARARAPSRATCATASS